MSQTRPLPLIDLPITTERLILRDFLPSDWEAVHAYRSEIEVARHMFWVPNDEAGSRWYLNCVIAEQPKAPRMTWELAIVRRADNRLIGACDLTLETTLIADLGYSLARDAWGQGYAFEAARAMVVAGF